MFISHLYPHHREFMCMMRIIHTENHISSPLQLQLAPEALPALGSHISMFPTALRCHHGAQSHPNPNAHWKQWTWNIQLKCSNNHCMRVGGGGKKTRRIASSFFNQKFLPWRGASPSEMLCCESGPVRSVKFHWGLALIPSPQPFLLATLVSAFVEPVSEVPNNLHISYSKLELPATDQSSPTALQRCGCFFFYIYYCCQTNPTANNSRDRPVCSQPKVHRKTVASSHILQNSHFLLYSSKASLINNQINIILLNNVGNR